MSSKDKEFDRGMCFTFFHNYHEQIELVKKMYGTDKAMEVYEAIVNYALYEQEIETDEIKLLVGAPTLSLIDNNQQRRSRSFGGEDLEQTRAVILFHRDHPEMSQNQIAKSLQISKGKVNKVLKILRETPEKYENLFPSGIDSDIDSDTYNDIDTYIHDRDRDQFGHDCDRDRQADHEKVASLPPNGKPKLVKIFNEHILTLEKLKKAFPSGYKRIKNICDNLDADKQLYNLLYYSNYNTNLNTILRHLKDNGLNKDYCMTKLEMFIESNNNPDVFKM